jgi:hypothetical protein
MPDPVRTRPNGVPRNVQQPTAGAQVTTSPPMQHFVMDGGRSMKVGGPSGGSPTGGVSHMGPAGGLPRRNSAPPQFQQQQVAQSPAFSLDQLKLMRDLVQAFGASQVDAGAPEAELELCADTLDQIEALIETMPKPKPSAAERLRRVPIEQIPQAVATAAPRRVPRAPAIVPAETDLVDDDAPAAG